MKKYFVGAVLVLILLALLAWSPWLTEENAQQKVTDATVAKGFGRIPDGCGPVQGIRNLKRVPFGITVEIKYECGFGLRVKNPDDNYAWHKVYVDPLGAVHGL